MNARNYKGLRHIKEKKYRIIPVSKATITWELLAFQEQIEVEWEPALWRTQEKSIPWYRELLTWKLQKRLQISIIQISTNRAIINKLLEIKYLQVVIPGNHILRATGNRDKELIRMNLSFNKEVIRCCHRFRTNFSTQRCTCSVQPKTLQTKNSYSLERWNQTSCIKRLSQFSHLFKSKIQACRVISATQARKSQNGIIIMHLNKREKSPRNLVADSKWWSSIVLLSDHLGKIRLQSLKKRKRSGILIWSTKTPRQFKDQLQTHIHLWRWWERH